MQYHVTSGALCDAALRDARLVVPVGSICILNANAFRSTIGRRISQGFSHLSSCQICEVALESDRSRSLGQSGHLFWLGQFISTN